VLLFILYRAQTQRPALRPLSFPTPVVPTALPGHYYFKLSHRYGVRQLSPSRTFPPFRMSKPLSSNGATWSRLLRAVVLLRKLLSKPRRSNESTAPARTSNHVHYLLRAPTPAFRPGWSYSLERQITCTSVCVSERRCPKPNRFRRARAAHTAFCVSEPNGNGDSNAGSRCSPNRQSRANHAPMSLLATFRSDRSHGFTVPAHHDLERRMVSP
jgi:hypothetical protein